MRYDNIIWDFDGTLFDTYPPMCRDLQSVMAALGVLLPLEDLLAHFTRSRGEVLDYCAAQAGMDAQAVDRVYRDWVAQHGQPKAEPFPHAEEILRRFQAAGGRNFIFTHRSGSVHQYLAGAGLTGYFQDVVSAMDRFERKPSPAGNLYLISAHGLDPARTLAVGDRELDMLAAKGAGIDGCRFTPEGEPEEESCARWHIRSFAELAEILELPEEEAR